jgi:catechol 2,3-dioxygenase-like lactoylglutathione lyase family enzyme
LGGFSAKVAAEASMTAPLFNGISQIALSSADPAKLSAWYRDTLGVPVLFEAGGMTFFQTGATRFMIGPAQPEEAIGGDAIVYFEPRDWAEANAALEAAGVAFTGDGMVVQQAPGRELVVRAFRDPEGHTLALLGWRSV